jgi:hypothetical protein
VVVIGLAVVVWKRTTTVREPSMRILTASFGENCGAPKGNATVDVKKECDGKSADCTYAVDVDKLGDPAPRCEKTFAVEFECLPGGPRLREELPSGAGLRQPLTLGCPGPNPESNSVKIVSATYGGSCGAKAGNATADVLKYCRGRLACVYVVDVNRLGDPARGCAKDFTLDYACPDDQRQHTLKIPGEAGFRKLVNLVCPVPD